MTRREFTVGVTSFVSGMLLTMLLVLVFLILTKEQ